MKRNDFEQELQDILQGFDQAPPASVWRHISLRLTFMQSLSSWIILGLTTVGLISFSFFISTDFETKARDHQFPRKLILFVDSTFHADGSISIDTIFQELPILKEEQQEKNEYPEFDDAAMEGIIAAKVDSLLLIDTSRYNEGKGLFRSYCATCHNKDMKRHLTGPALAGVTDKYEKEWLYHFTRNSQKMIQEGDERALKVWDEWKPTVMTNFTNLNDEELDDLYYYIETKSMLD